MRIAAGNKFAYKITLLALLASSIAAVTLMATFLAFDSVSARAQMQARLATLADVVGQNSTAALSFAGCLVVGIALALLRLSPWRWLRLPGPGG